MKWVLRILVSVAALLVLAVVVLLAMGQRASANRIQSSIEVAAPPEKVWAWISEPAKFKEWVSWTVEVRTDRNQKPGVGAQAVAVMKDENNGGALIEVHSVCARWNRPHYWLKIFRRRKCSKGRRPIGSRRFQRAARGSMWK